MAKLLDPTPDIEQALLTSHHHHEQGQDHEHTSGPEPGWAVAPVRIPAARQSTDDHHVQAHSPMAYSAVGSFAQARKARRRYRLTTHSAHPHIAFKTHQLAQASSAGKLIMLKQHVQLGLIVSPSQA